MAETRCYRDCRMQSVGQYVDRKVLRVQVGLKRVRYLRNVPEHQWRLKGDGAEAVGGDAARPAMRINAGHDRDPGGEAAEALAQVVLGAQRFAWFCFGNGRHRSALSGAALQSILSRRAIP